MLINNYEPAEDDVLIAKGIELNNCSLVQCKQNHHLHGVIIFGGELHEIDYEQNNCNHQLGTGRGGRWSGLIDDACLSEIHFWTQMHILQIDTDEGDYCD